MVFCKQWLHVYSRLLILMHYIICTEIKISNIIPPLCGVRKTQWTERKLTRFELNPYNFWISCFWFKLRIRSCLVNSFIIILHKLFITLSNHGSLSIFSFYLWFLCLLENDIWNRHLFCFTFLRYWVYRARHLIQHNNAEWRFTLYTWLYGVLCNIM